MQTGINGSADFPTNVNDVYGLIETIASQEVKGLKSANHIADGFFNYEVENGKIIEEAVIAMAEKQAFVKDRPNLMPKDPAVYAQYFNNWETRQYVATVREDDIRAVIANKGVGVEDIVAEILDTTTQGENRDDFIDCRNALYKANFVNYRNILGGVPKTMKGVVYALRDMYNHLKCDNSDLTSFAYDSATPEGDIMIAVSPKLMNLIDVKEWAEVFNLQKEELFGRLIVVDVDDLIDHTHDYFAYVYDRKALGRATRIYGYTEDKIGSGRYANYYLTAERAIFHNGLFKGAFLDCTEACVAEKGTIIVAPTAFTVTKSLTNAATTSTVSSVVLNDPYTATFTANEGYTFDESATVSVTVGGVDVTEDVAEVSEDGAAVVVNVPNVGGNIVVTLSASAVEA